MKTSKLLLLGCVAGWLAMCPRTAHAELTIHISVKFILSSDGNRPSRENGKLQTDADVQDLVDEANEIMNRSGRGFHFRLREIRGVSGESQWFNADSRNAGSLVGLELDALADRAGYFYRSDAINVYINNSANSAVCSLPNTTSIILMGQGIPNDQVLIHEVGHYFNLSHTQGLLCGGCTEEVFDVDLGCTEPGDDELNDTLPDVACWDQNDIAQHSYDQNYAGLSDARKRLVDDVFFNVMSYHDNGSILTKDQLDRWTDAATGPRANVVTGRTWFVDKDTSCALGDGSPSCAGFDVYGPYKVISDATSRAGDNDVVLIRGGSYDVSPTFTRRMTFRASRGTAVIGR